MNTPIGNFVNPSLFTNELLSAFPNPFSNRSFIPQITSQEIAEASAQTSNMNLIKGIDFKSPYVLAAGIGFLALLIWKGTKR